MQFPFQLSDNKQFDAVGFGTNAVDYLIRVPKYPAFNSKVELDDYVQMAGGEIASTMVGLRRLGMKTAYVGRFGADAAGDFGLQTVRDAGVDVRFAEQIEGARTQIAFILIDAATGERTVIWKRDALLAFAPEEAPIELMAETKIFHATPHDAAACVRLAKAAKASGAVVSIDIDNLFPGVEEMIPLVDVFLSSAEFPERLLGIADRKTALREIKARFGCPVVGTTLGEKGSLILAENEFVETAGFAVPGGCRDTTGAGDAFRVGFLYGLLRGETIETTARMANAVAALKCRAVGARTALPSETELFELIKN